MSDEFSQKVKRAKTGDKEVLIDLIMSQKQEFYRLAYVFMKNPDDAMDALEDMILIVYENIRKLNDESAFYSWSKTILVNCCKKNLRRRDKIILFKSIPEGLQNDVFLEKDKQIDLEQQLETLKQKYSEVIKLRYYLDLDYESIAEISKIPLGTVKSRIHTGLQILKQSMGVNNE